MTTKSPNIATATPIWPTAGSTIYDRKTGIHYACGNVLGEGGFARCYEVVDPSGNHLAAKVIRKASLTSQKQKHKLFAEIKIHQTMAHPGVVKFYHVFEDDDNVYILLELCDNRTMADMLKVRRRLTEPEVRYYMWHLLQAVDYMHRHRVIHRDLKLGNLFLTSNMELRVGDFGLAATIRHDGERKKTICGTPNYIAPEVLFDSQNGHSFEVDMWSLGVVMYTLLIGKPPFQTKEVKAIYKKIRDNVYDFPSQIPISNNARSIISALLNKSPVSDIINHEFFTAEPIPASLPTSALTKVPVFPPAVNPQVEAAIPMMKNMTLETKENSASPQKSTKSRPASNNTVVSPLKETMLNGNSGNLPMETPPKLVATPPKAPAVAPPLKAPSDEHPPVARSMLEIMYKNISAACKRVGTPNAGPRVKSQEIPPDIFITKWIDYSNKYGLGYQLRDGSIGVYFNDSTSILLAADNNHIEYLYYDNVADSTKMHRRAYTLANFPKDLQKKVTLLKHFGGYMQENLFKAVTYGENSKPPRTSDLIFLTKYLRTRHGVIFRLSNQVVQLNLFDHTKLILSNGATIVTYIDKSREMHTMHIDNLMASEDSEVIDRINYAKDILLQMILKKQKKAAIPPKR
ncbi:Cell cycle serine/threonine-protein kinase cdc5/MSD2 [Chytridiales sp. JEL 0842]|nr:Cell cycle serine/threonine-protein kinase cdc5/MSD2 [Chytridiales sp. JEL 0842]